jgi:hypothetical protein
MSDIVNVGTTPNDGTGDSLRAAMQKINARFDEMLSITQFAGCDITGASDMTATFVAAIALAKTVGYGGLYFPRGKYKIDTGAIALANVALHGVGVQESASPYDDAGSVILLTGTTNSPFALGRGATVEGLTFFWPNQTDASATPTAYPPLFAGTYVSQFKFNDNTVVNAYDFFKINAGGVGVGDNQFSGNRIYAIRRYFDLANGAPESMWITENLFTWGVYEDVVNAGPNYYLRKWTQQNGEFMRIDVGAGSWTHVDGLHLMGNLIFGSRYGMRIMSGYLNVSTIALNTWDAVPTVLSLESSAQIFNSSFDGNTCYSYRFDNTASEDDTISCTSTAFTSDFDISNNKFLYSRGDHIFWNSSASDDVSIVGNRFASWGQSTQASITAYYALGFTDAGVKAHIASNRFAPTSGAVAHQRSGFICGGAADVFLTGNYFDACELAVWFVSTFAGRAVVQGNMSKATAGGQSFRDDTTTAGLVECMWNTWDKNPAANGYPAFNAVVAAGQTISSGTKTKLNFGTEQLDGDGNYDPTTSTFTAPVSGLYAFAVHLMNDAGVTIGEVWKLTIDAAGGAAQSRGTTAVVVANTVGAASARLEVQYALTAGDTVTANIQRTTGANNYVVANDTAMCHFHGRRVQ